jgi:hypothetical protein
MHLLISNRFALEQHSREDTLMNTTLNLDRAAGKFWIPALLALISIAPMGNAQSFTSGSNGTDGSFDLTGTSAGKTVNFVPSNFPGDQHSLNIFNFTTITIPAGVTVRLSAKTINGPVIWLANGGVDIEGTIDLSGQAGLPVSAILDGRRRSLDAGVGGYAGGVGGKSDGSTTTANEPLARAGDGPGGGVGAAYGVNDIGSGGTFSGNAFLSPLIGGSGGGGGLFQGILGSTAYGASGGAGGGALLIASSTTITVIGTINANGGAGGGGGIDDFFGSSGFGGGGSGGGIRLITNTIAGTGVLTAAGGASPCTYCAATTPGGNGVIRIEAFTDTFTGTITGTQTMGSPFAAGVVLPTTPPPSVSVISVSSVNLPPTPTGSLSAPDVTISNTSAVTLTVQASYIPVGTILTLHVFSDNDTDQTVQTTPLSGTVQSSQATATVTFPSGYSLNHVKASWTAAN